MKKIRKVSYIFSYWLEHLRVKLIFLLKIFQKFFLFSCDFIIVKVKMGYNIWVRTYGNKIDKLGKYYK